MVPASSVCRVVFAAIGADTLLIGYLVLATVVAAGAFDDRATSSRPDVPILSSRVSTVVGVDSRTAHPDSWWRSRCSSGIRGGAATS